MDVALELRAVGHRVVVQTLFDERERVVDEGLEHRSIAAAAEARGRRWAMFLPYALPLTSPDTPAFGPGFAPPRNGLERLRYRAVWGADGAATRKQMARPGRLRTAIGAAPIHRHGDLFLRSDALLYRTAEPFDDARSAWPANVHPVGPGLWAPPGEAPPWPYDPPRPRVLVSVSTEFQDDGAVGAARAVEPLDDLLETRQGAASPGRAAAVATAAVTG